MNRLYLPIISILLFISESLFVDLFPAELFSIERIFVPHFLFIAIIFITIYVKESYGMMYGAVFGLLFDIVYTEIIGVYMFSFTIIVYIVAKAMKALHANVFISSILSIIATILLELFIFGVNILIGNTNLSFQIFLDNRLFPTIVLNFVFVILVSYPLKKHLQNIASKLEE